MSKKKWFILIALGMGLGLLGVALLVVLVFGFLFGNGEATASATGLPVYMMEQSASSHAGYRHSSLTRGDEIYVSDYEEGALQLANPEPSSVIGVQGPMGISKVCSIPGQPITAYIAVDCGGEMPAFAPYRNIKQAPFDWRTATFREMSAYHMNGGGPYLPTTDAALLAEVVRTLRDGTPVELPDFSFADSATKLGAIKMTCDQLPGLLFCPVVFTDANGQIYLAESTMLDTASTPLQLHARWIAASPALTEWLKAPK